jgi:putative transposase
VFVVLSHYRRRIVHVNVTSHPTALWTAQQLREAWPWDTLPRFVIRDRDAVYGSDPQRTLKQMGTEEVLTAPRCPWQSPFVERVIGSIRRECLDHVIVWNERSLHRHLSMPPSFKPEEDANTAYRPIVLSVLVICAGPPS